MVFFLIRIGKFGWEKRWGSLENNILLLYREESDVNFIDTFDLNFAEIDVIVYSVISSVEFFNIVSIDLLYVLKLEYEFFIICWFRRCVLFCRKLNKVLIYRFIIYRIEIKV